MDDAWQRLNHLTEDEARAALTRCCGARRWVEAMLARRPFASNAQLHACAEEAWAGLGQADYVEAFAHHPAIGQARAELEHRFGSTADWSTQEQAGAQVADAPTKAALQAGNQKYAERFGFTFIICATGKSADEILQALRARLGNSREVELAIAAAQQLAITQLRLQKLPLSTF